MTFLYFQLKYFLPWEDLVLSNSKMALSSFHYNSNLVNTSQPGPGTTWEKFDEFTSPIWTFYITQSFLSHDLFGF